MWAYSISAVKQDDFSDIDEEARALAKANSPGAGAQVSVVARDGMCWEDRLCLCGGVAVAAREVIVKNRISEMGGRTGTGWSGGDRRGGCRGLGGACGPLGSFQDRARWLHRRRAGEDLGYSEDRARRK